jgi:coenzyme F420 biosynthesis associated uncharacterized protein
VTEPDATPPTTTPDPVDWGTARRVARFVAKRDALAESYLGASLHDDFASLTRFAESVVSEFTGLRAPGNVAVGVLDRHDWIDANITSMRRLLEPLFGRLGARLARSPLAPVGRHLAATEMGALIGFLSQRVLGQYDLLVPDEHSGDAVYYVGPNILSLEKRFAFRPRDFRLWIALHEVTHRAQFTGVPWMRPYFFGLVQQAFDAVDPDPRAVLQAVSRAFDEMRRNRNPLDDGGLLGLFATPEQRAVLRKVQALMSLLEGHGNYVMNELGRIHVPGEERMDRVLHERRNVGGIAGYVQKLLGIEQKMKQYEVGERFVRATVDLAGPGAIDRAWISADHLPTLDEFDDPSAWVERVDRLQVAS